MKGNYFLSRILLDAGDKNVGEYQKHLSDVVNSEQLNIEHIVVTHWHHDHIGGVENLYGSIASMFLKTIFLKFFKFSNTSV